MAYTAYRVQVYMRHGENQTAITGYSGFPNEQFSRSCTWMHACSMVEYVYMGRYSWNGLMHAIGESPVAALVIAHLQFFSKSTQAVKQGMV